MYLRPAVLLEAALRSLRRAPLRSSLAMLSVSIGVAAVVAIVSVGNGARANVEHSLAMLESNQLAIDAEPPRQGRSGLPPNDGLTLDDYFAIQREVHGIAASTVLAFAPTTSKSLTEIRSVLGIDAEGLRVLGRRIMHGSGFGAEDVKAATSTCVIPEFVAHALFEDVDAIGKFVRIGGTVFTIVGVATDDPGFQKWAGHDTVVLVPYTSVRKRLTPYPKISIMLRADDPANLGEMQSDVVSLLERRRGDRIARFVTTDVSDVLRRRADTSRTLTLLLGCIGGISLVVGGIGIMNVMFVSIVERTREIGVRLALGTRPFDVMVQFALEATLLSILGGLLGILVGIGAARAIATWSDWPVLITPGAIAAAFLCSAACGVFFGYSPAKRAAALDPVVALRAE